VAVEAPEPPARPEPQAATDAARPAPKAKPQPDLFEPPAPLAGADAATLHPVDKTELRDLVSRLIALRAEMLANPRG
jgi:hypothetical protein